MNSSIDAESAIDFPSLQLTCARNIAKAAVYTKEGIDTDSNEAMKFVKQLFPYSQLLEVIRRRGKRSPCLRVYVRKEVANSVRMREPQGRLHEKSMAPYKGYFLKYF